MYPENAGNILFGGVNDVRVAHRADREILIPHVQQQRHVHAGQRVAVRRYVVEEQLEVAYHHKLPDPAFLDAAQLGHFDVAFVGGADASGRVDSQRPLCCSSDANN